MRERAAAEAALATETGQEAAPFVEVVHPVGDAPDQTLVLPGQTMAFIDTPDLRARQRLPEKLELRHRRAM